MKSALSQALRAGGRWILVAAFLVTFHIPGQAASGDTETALITAVRQNNIKRVKQLAGNQARIDDSDEYLERTALMWAADLGSVPMVKILLQQGADVTLRDDEGTDAIDLARAKGHSVIVQMLERAKARAASQIALQRGAK